MTESASPYKLLDSRVVYDNGWVCVREDRVIRPRGDQGIFGVVTMKEGSTVLPVTSDGEVYLVREFKYGIGKDSIEAMSGGFEAGENPLDAARRELEEELGLGAKDWTYLGHVDPFTTVVRSPNHMFLAQGLFSGNAQNDPNEVVESIRMPLDEAVSLVMNGGITHSASCVLLLKAWKILR